MKEYICKKDLISRIESESRMWGEDYDSHQILGDIEDFPTVTKADIKKSILQEVWNKALGHECLGFAELEEILEQIKEQGE